MDLVFSTYMKQSGSYLWLAQRLAEAFKRQGKEATWINDVLHYDGPTYKDAIHVHFTTINMLPAFLNSPARKKFGHTYVVADTILVFHPLLQLNEWQQKFDFTLFTPSIYNYQRLSKFAKVRYFPHVVPVERFIPFEARQTYYVVGANEPDYDRKGMFLAWWMKQMGFNVKMLCHNLCPGGTAKPNLTNEEAEAMWNDVKWYLAISHAESPHLPLLEAYLHGIPSFYHSATEFKYIGIGVRLPTAYPQIRGSKQILAWEYDYDKLWDALHELYTFPEDLYRKLSWSVFELARKWFGPSRLKDFLNMDDVAYNPIDIVADVERIREALAEDLKTWRLLGEVVSPKGGGGSELV